jgi:hypothetical protein
VDPDRLSRTNVQRIRSWVFTSDRGYQRAGISSYLPSRLLDLKPEQSPQAPSSWIRIFRNGVSAFQGRSRCDSVLVDTSKARPQISSASEASRYVALSYCWGSSGPPLKTEKHSLKQRLRGIPIHTMPPCFRDAIEVIRAIGLRYLWIDALCIIQDDPQDWQVESGSMFDIFSNAFLTIGVASTSSCQESFLKKSLPQRFHIPFQSRTNPSISRLYTIQKAPPKRIPDHSYSDDPLPWMGDLFNSEWNKRGWVWQEQNMAKKLLVWGESMFHLRDEDVDSEDGSGAAGWHAAATLRDAEREGADRVEARWYKWMREFSEKKLSVRTDRLAAVSGLAKRVASVLDAPYRAGHWYSKDNFWRSICWSINYPPK